jgi:hypothetical protein
MKDATIVTVSPEPAQTFRTSSVDPTGAVSFTDKVIVGSLAETKKWTENQFAGDGLSPVRWTRFRWLNYTTRCMLYGDREVGEGVLPFLLAVIDKEA